MNQETSQARHPGAPGTDDIEPYQLLKLLWNRRRFLLILTAAGLLGSLLFVLVRPEPQLTYTAKAELQIGKLGGVNLESPGDIAAYLQSDAFQRELPEGSELAISFRDLKKELYPKKRERGEISTQILSLTLTAGSRQSAETALKTATERLLERHGSLYREALDELETARRELQPYREQDARLLPALWLESYTFRTQIISGPEVTANPPEENDAVQVAVTTFSALVIAIIAALLYEGVLNWRRQEREGRHA